MAKTSKKTLDQILAGDDDERAALLHGIHSDPHRLLGPHPARRAGQRGVVVRVFHPGAKSVEIVPATGAPVAATALERGIFAAWLPGAERDLAYRVATVLPDGTRVERDDPYRFAPTLSDLDLYLIAEGTHLELWRSLGARAREVAGVRGFAFAVWAPNAQRVSVVGDFCGWNGRLRPMRRLGSSGVWELFIPELATGELYKYEILTHDGRVRRKADPLARYAERPPGTASRTHVSSYRWGDDAWMAAAAGRDVTREPLAIYEVHLGSWKSAAELDPGYEPPRASAGKTRSPAAAPRPLDYRRLAEALVAHVKTLGFDAVELMPVAEHPYDGSWGYQITGYYAPTARFGDPDDFRYFVDHCHRNGIAVILDWVPAHFVTDAHGLGRFDGTALYEHEDPRRGFHPDWGTYIWNFGRYEVRNFLVSNVLYWLEEFHVDALRVDAVASMLYLDYSREEGEWLPNEHGGKENLEAIALLRAANDAVRERCPGRYLIAEESTAWGGVTAPTSAGGLGFTFKWNMGWMHDTLSYFSTDPLFRAGNHDRLTFAMVYEHSERFINPLSHDEVVHGKGSLYAKMPGDSWRKLANLRTLFAYLYTRPGKKLLFMGSELAPIREWSHETPLDWYLAEDPDRAGLQKLLADLGALYHEHPCLWRSDPDPEGFAWLACHDRERSVVAYERRETEAGERLIVVLNLTPMPREDYLVGVPAAGRYRVLLSTDDLRYGGSGYAVRGEVATGDEPADGCRQSLVLTLPPLAALVLEPVPGEVGEPDPAPAEVDSEPPADGE